MGMMRVSQCCCGCSLRTGTLIILWLTVLHGVYSIVQYSVAAFDSRSAFQFLDASVLTYECVILVVSIYALVGVEKHRPSYMLPYIGMSVANLVLGALLLLFLWVGSIALRVHIMDTFGGQRFVHNRPDHSSNKMRFDDNIAEENQRAAYNAIVSVFTFSMVVALAISFYLFAVVYSYYKQMQEEDQGIFNPGNGGIVYAAPATQPGKSCVDQPPAYVQPTIGSLYPQQTVGYPQQTAGYPQQTAGYPQQTAGYPQQTAGYPQQNVDFTQQNMGYPQQNVGYPQQSPVYPPVIDQK